MEMIIHCKLTHTYRRNEFHFHFQKTILYAMEMEMEILYGTGKFK